MRHLPPLHRSARVSGLEPMWLSPNALQTARAGQATPPRVMFWAPAGLGVAWTCQVRPFHRSARVLARVWFPTAVHAVAEVQDTPLRNALRPAGAGLKVGTIRQVWPSHRSASVPRYSPVAGSSSPPTARQDDRDGHETPVRVPPSAGLGVGWMVQVWPFHRCARVSEVPRRLLVFPTAMQAERDTQDAAFRLLAAAPVGLGVCWMLHVLPFHRSASVAGDWLLPPFGPENPTARQPVAEVQATPISELITPPGRLGVGWIAQLAPSHRSARAWNTPEELI